MNRMPEVEILPACEYYGLGVVPYSPLARGVLTGKYPPGKAPPKGSRAGRKDKRMLESEFREESLVVAQKIKQHAEAKGMTAARSEEHTYEPQSLMRPSYAVYCLKKTKQP